MIPLTRLRFTVDPQTFSAPVNAIDNQPPQLWRGSPARLEIAFASGGAILADISNILALTVQIKSAGPAGAAPPGDRAPQASATVDSFDAALTSSTWTAGSAQHAIVTFEGSELNLPDPGPKWLVIVAQLANVTDPVTLGAFSFDLAEDGYDSGAGAPPTPAATYLNAEQTLALLAGKLDISAAASQEDAESGTGTGWMSAARTAQAIAALAEGGALLDQIATIYVSKAGDNSNSGLSVNVPKLTIAAALGEVSVIFDEAAATVRIDVLDAGEYTENLTIPSWVHVRAPAATLRGTVSIEAYASFVIGRHVATTNNAIMAQHGGESGPAFYSANISDGRGGTGVRNIRNVGGGGRNFFAHVGVLYVGNQGIGVGDVSTGDAGHIHIEIPDLYLAGNNAIGILGASQGIGNGDIVGWVDHILEIGTPTGTVGISLTAAGASVKLVAAEIIAATAYSITAGSLYLACPKITGTQTGTPAQKLIGTADLNTALAIDPAASRTALGGGAAGQEIFTAATHTGAGSTRAALGLDTTSTVTFGNTSVAVLTVTGNDYNQSSRRMFTGNNWWGFVSTGKGIYIGNAVNQAVSEYSALKPLSSLHFAVGTNAVIALGADTSDRPLITAAAPIRMKEIEIPAIGEGVILTSPDGTRYRLTVENDGTLTTTDLTP
jgi:hypothetical protein